MHPTDLTVAAVIERDDKFLLVEEYAMGRRVVTQPGGHIEADESPEQAVEREVLEESGVTVDGPPPCFGKGGAQGGGRYHEI